MAGQARDAAAIADSGLHAVLIDIHRADGHDPPAPHPRGAAHELISLRRRGPTREGIHQRVGPPALHRTMWGKQTDPATVRCSASLLSGCSCVPEWATATSCPGSSNRRTESAPTNLVPPTMATRIASMFRFAAAPVATLQADSPRAVPKGRPVVVQGYRAGGHSRVVPRSPGRLIYVDG